MCQRCSIQFLNSFRRSQSTHFCLLLSKVDIYFEIIQHCVYSFFSVFLPSSHLHTSVVCLYVLSLFFSSVHQKTNCLAFHSLKGMGVLYISLLVLMLLSFALSSPRRHNNMHNLVLVVLKQNTFVILSEEVLLFLLGHLSCVF